MTKTAQKIADIADQLTPEAQQALLDMAESLAKPSRFYDTMTDAQRLELGQSIEEAGAGRVGDEDQLDTELDALFAKRASRSNTPIPPAGTSPHRSATSSIRALSRLLGDCAPASPPSCATFWRGTLVLLVTSTSTISTRRGFRERRLSSCIELISRRIR